MQNTSKQKIKISLLFILVSLFSNISENITAQTREDYNHFFHRCDFSSMSDSDSLLFYAKKLQSSENQYIHLYGKIREANYRYKEKNYALCESILHEVLNTIENNRRPESFFYLNAMQFDTYEESMTHLKLMIYLRFFYIRKNQYKLNAAYDYLILRDSLYDQLESKDSYYHLSKLKIAREKGLIKREMGSLHESLNILLPLETTILQLIDQSKDEKRKQFLYEHTMILSEIASNYQRLAKKDISLIDSSFLYHEKAYQASLIFDSSGKNKQKHKRSLLIKRSNLYRLKKDFYSALKCLDTVSQYAGSEKDYLYLLKTLCFDGLKKHDSIVYYASKYLNSEIHQAHQRKVYEILKESYFSVDELDSAYKYSTLTLELTKKNTDVLKEAYLKVNQDDQNQHRKITTAIQNKQRRTRTLLVIISVIFVITSISSIILIKRRKKKNKESYLQLYHKFMSLKLEPPKTPSQPNSAKEVNITDKLTAEVLNGLKKIEQSQLYMNKNFNLVYLAKFLNTNTSYLSKIVNQEKGKTFKEYLLELRMNTLIKTLNDVPKFRKYTVEALAEYSGYKNASSFSRAFKGFFKVSPSEYLKLNYKD